MQRELIITADPIEETALLASRRVSPGAGAVVTFLGFVRGLEDGAGIRALDYECFREMAEHQFQLLFDELQQRWPIESVRLIHRIGLVPVSEASLWVEIISGHRGEAFAACQWLIDRMKQVVPIWKKPVNR